MTLVNYRKNRPTKRSGLLLLAFVVSLMAVAMLDILPSGASAQTTITTDQPDYAPGSNVTITGAGWATAEPVHIVVEDAGHTWSNVADVTADGNGDFTYSFTLPSWFIANYSATATGPLSGTATTTFTDLSIGTYDQCSNDDGDGYATGDTGCRWTNGNLQSNNSTYFEGDATVQRVWLTDFPADGNVHSVVLQYGTTKGGHHAYDYLTDWDYSENWITLADRCQDIAGCETATERLSGDIPQDPDANVPDGAGRNFTIRGGTITAVSAPVLESGTYAGDSETHITVSFIADSGGSMCHTGSGKNPPTLCDVAIWFGAHIALTSEWPVGGGASQVSGSPYHVALTQIDGASVGQRDNQMQANTIAPTGTVVINKVCTGGTGGTFGYTGTGTGITAFSLACGGSQTFTSIASGAKTVTESAPPSGWHFVSLSCTDPDNGTTVTGQTANIDLDNTETVTCTYTNARDQGYLKISKVFDPKTSGFNGTFDIVYNCGAGNVTVSLAAGGSTTVGPFDTGTSCSVSEPILPTAPTGWTFGTPSVSGSPATITKGDQAAAVSVSVTNTITRDLGKLVLSKTFDPGTSGFNGTFAIHYDCSDGVAHDGTVNLSAGGSQEITGIPTGTVCTVTEPTLPTAPAGYSFGTPTFTDTSGTANDGVVTIPSGDGSSVSVATNNSISRDHGTIVIIKNAKPQQGTFTFNTTGSTSSAGTSWPSSFTLTGATAGGGNSRTFTVDTGTYSATESTQLNWTLTGIGGSTDPLTPLACTVTGTGGSTGLGSFATQTVTIVLKKGDTVTCVFENTGNGATRTQGFWATHPQLAQIAWFGGSGYGHTFPGVPNTQLCSRNIDTLGKLMGGFWSDISKDSNNKKRSALDQARMQLLQQLLAAELNASAFGTLPSGGWATIDSWESAYCGNNQNDIKNAQQQAASFNTQGDNSTFTPGTSADSKSARANANYTFWDVLP
jgi:hypothetical protein